MANETTHHDINEAVSLAFDEKRIEKLRRKQQPKTEIERTKPIYDFFMKLAKTCECMDAIAMFAGVIHFSSTHLNKDAFWLLIFVAGFIVWLSYKKHEALELFHAQRLDDGHIPRITYIFLAGLLVVSMAATYNVTTPAVEFFAPKPTLISIDSVSNRHDSLLAADLLVIAKEVQTHDTTANAIFSARSWLNKLDRKSGESFAAALNDKSKAESKKTDLKIARNALKESEINKAKDKNEAIIKGHLAWCAKIGGFIALVLIILEIALFPSTWYCSNYEKKEVIEADKKKAIAKGQSVSPSTNSQNTQTSTNAAALPQKSTKGKRQKVFNSPNLAPTMQIKQGKPTTSNIEPKEGDILPPQGKGVHRVLIEVNGKLDARTRGELRTLKAAQGNPESDRAKFIQSLIDKLP